MNKSEDVASFVLDTLRLLVIESYVAKWKSEGQITEESYKVFREVADKQWHKQDKRGAKLLGKVKEQGK